MNNENIEFLSNNVKYLGFEEKVSKDMTDQISQGKNEFSIGTNHAHFANSVDYNLHFKKSEQTDRYFLNRYDATLKNGNPEEDRSQTFYIKNSKGITAKEAFNLLEGRFVYKEMLNKEQEKYHARLKLDFDKKDDKDNHKYIRYSDSYGYKLEDTLAKVPIREMQDAQQKANLIKSLDRGNLQQVQIDTEQNPGKYYITPDPVKGLRIFNERMQPVEHKNLGLNLHFKKQQSEKKAETVKEQQSPKQTKRQSQKATEGETGKKQSKGQKMKAA
ncbi:hypothetical protein SAMN05216464_108111 [Mucilaginibacter pineti]|uniref:Uncharacterized protein n=1 Tax=Mucilaginibacter pineti TaxID=1391627 RepID=A0A1G7EQ55_9SPHI|nr:hypothetical protein [Mucilaginibacter pineti]SDE65576.1 hypothetical protein SAMN05216464_108111 [Mucilaginibacter pineti]